MSNILKQFLLFTCLVILMEVAAGLGGKMMQGQPWGSMDGWSGVAVIVCTLLFICCLVGIAAFFVGMNFEGIARVFATVGLVCLMLTLIVGFGIIGLKWLENGGDAFKNAGLWWPLPTFVACCIAWFAKLSRR